MRSSFQRLISRLATWPAAGAGTGRKRVYVLRAAAVGLALGLAARAWMRTISGEHVFTVGGTVFIVLFFGGLGALTGLVFWWRRSGHRPRRDLVVRGAGLAPFALMGPFVLLFLPSLLAALLTGRSGWRRWPRRLAMGAAVVSLLFTELILLTADVPGSEGVRVASGLLYLPLAYALFISNRLAFDPLPPRESAAGRAPAKNELLTT